MSFFLYSQFKILMKNSFLTVLFFFFLKLYTVQQTSHELRSQVTEKAKCCFSVSALSQKR